VLAALIGKCNTYSHRTTPWPALLELARIEVQLGEHDEAEGLLTRLRRGGPDDLQGPGLLLLAEIAITRQEPWADEILDAAELRGLKPQDAVLCATLRIERAVRLERADTAEGILAEARRLAKRCALPEATARVHTSAGDLLRLRGRHDEAETEYTAALKATSDPELEGRLWLRLGDLEAARRQSPEAHYRRALTLFVHRELPVREAWCALRLARVSADEQEARRLLQAAATRFLEADIAAGVAAADSLSGRPGASLQWHIGRARDHARARQCAQDTKPPLRRSDADRPERRLGAHRLAIAACDESIVEVLAAELNTCARLARAGRGRALDPPVLRYVGAVDLLAGHRSYSAARVLLTHLLDQRVEGAAYRALQGAIARAPNAALVDGLLRCVEAPKAHPSHAVAAAAELLGMRRESAAINALLRLTKDHRGPVIRRAAVAALGRIGDRRAIDVIAGALQEPALAERSALSLLLLGDRRGIDFHARALMEARTDLQGHPGELVGRFGGPDHLLLLISSSKLGGAMGLGAMQGIGLLGDSRGVPALLEALEIRDQQTLAVASGALSIVTGHHEDIEVPGARQRWRSWWSDNHGRFPEGKRYRLGELHDAGLLIGRMGHPDAYSRRTAYDELVIATGVDLPFDAEGPWRIQQAHVASWQRWWAKNRSAWQSGRWYLDGGVFH